MNQSKRATYTDKPSTVCSAWSSNILLSLLANYSKIFYRKFHRLNLKLIVEISRHYFPKNELCWLGKQNPALKESIEHFEDCLHYVRHQRGEYPTREIPRDFPKLWLQLGLRPGNWILFIPYIRYSCPHWIGRKACLRNLARQMACQRTKKGQHPNDKKQDLAKLRRAIICFELLGQQSNNHLV